MTVNPEPSQSVGMIPIDYAKKYWWAGAIAVPIIVALIGFADKWPFGGSNRSPGGINISNSGNTTTNSGNISTNSNNTTITTTNNNFVVESTATLSFSEPALVSKLQDVATQMTKRNFAAAVKQLEDIPEDKRNAAVWNYLGVAYAGANEPQRARAAFEQARTKDPKDELAKTNLARIDVGSPADSLYKGSNDILNPNEIMLNTPVQAVVANPGDTLYFAFSTSDTKRDLVDVAVKNNSTTLTPSINIYDPNKNKIYNTYSGTPGADASYTFIPKPQERYFVQVGSCCNAGPTGSYTLTIRPQKAYDAYEPNEDILHASAIAIGKTIEAGIMDADDIDVYAFDVGEPAKLVAALENRSTTLAPGIKVYDPGKSQTGQTYNGTPGGDLNYSFDAPAKGRYFIQVNSCCNGGPSGNYKLTIRPE